MVDKSSSFDYTIQARSSKCHSVYYCNKKDKVRWLIVSNRQSNSNQKVILY